MESHHHPVTDGRISVWLADFEAALAVRDIERIVAKFGVVSGVTSSPSWNIKTLEGRDAIADMLTARLAETDRRGSAPGDRPTTAARVSAFISSRRSDAASVTAPQGRRRGDKPGC
jgi:putative flavoprotein involved in K+ transport